MRIKPYDPNRPRKPTTPAQDAARERSFRIFRLRGLYSFALLLTGPRRSQMQALVDQELADLDAETEYARDTKRKLAWALDDYDAQFEEVAP